MNFLSRLVIPESTEHLALLRYLLVVVSILIVTYSSIALIASTASAVLDSYGRRKGHGTFSRFARDLADLAAPGPGVVISLAVIPLITIILAYTQLFSGTDIGIPLFLTAAAVFYFTGFYFLVSYKKSFHLDSIYNAYGKLAGSHRNEIDSNVADDFEAFGRKAASARMRAGRRAAILLWIATWIFVGSVRYAFHPSGWASSEFVTILLSGGTFVSLLNYLVSALLIASASVLFFFFKWEKGIAISADEEYRSFVKRLVLPVGLVAVALEPVLIFFDIRSLPQTGISSATFGLAGVSLLLAFILLHLFYSMIKESDVNVGHYIFVGVILMVVIWAAKDEIALSYATRNHDQVLGQRYETMLAELNPETAAPVVSGEDIYSGRCSACHRFDIRLVGPPYNQTLPNFVGKMDSLEDFIMNPRQVVAGYPPMPNQGLKPAEVKAVAEYIMGVYLKSHPQAAGKDTTKAKI
ncbi:MAG TPA: cytochrome c [Candidatus Kryptonia bacterium]